MVLIKRKTDPRCISGAPYQHQDTTAMCALSVSSALLYFEHKQMNMGSLLVVGSLKKLLLTGDNGRASPYLSPH